MFGISRTNLYGPSSLPSKQKTVSVKQRNGTRVKMKYHTLSTSSLATEGKKSTLTIYADMNLHHDKIEAELVATRQELEGVQHALHLQTQRCRELVTEFSRKLRSKEFQINTERQLRDQQLAKVLRALLIFEARLVQEQKIISEQLREKDNIIKYQQMQIYKLQSANEGYCKNCQSSTFESLESSSDIYAFQNGTLFPQQNNHNLNQESFDSSSDIYATISEKDYKQNDNHSTSSEETRSQTDYDSLKRGTFIKNKQNHPKFNESKRVKKYANNRKPTGTYFESIRRRESCIDSSSNDEGSDKNQTTKISDNVSDNIDKVSQRIETIFTDNKEKITACEKFSEKIENLHGIKRGTVEKMHNSDDIYTNSSISGDSSSTNYCSPGDIRGSYEPNGNFTYNSSTKSESELTATYSESTKNNDGDNVSIEVYEINGDINDNNKFTDNENHNGVRMGKTNHYLNEENRFLFEKTDPESDNWYASASDQEEDQQCDIYKNNPVLECMNQILLHNIQDTNSPPKSPVPIIKNKSCKRVKFFDEKDESNNKEAVQRKSNYQQEETVAVPSSESNYYETPIQGVANVYEVPQSIYSNDYEQILIGCNENFQNWTNAKNQHPSSKLENLQEKEVNRMSSQKLSVVKNSELENLENTNNYYYVDMDSKVSDGKTGQIVRKYKIARTPPALPPKPANLVSKYKIQNKKPNSDNISDCDKNEAIDVEPDYCSISELNMASESEIPKIVTTATSPTVAHITALYDQIIADAANCQLQRTEKKNTLEKQPKASPQKTQVNGTKEVKTIKNVDIPKLPQVSEIIIPSESESETKDERISQDNYIKNNSQFLKQKPSKSNIQQPEKLKYPIQIGTSVSNLITGFNNQHILSEINNRKISPSKSKTVPEKVFSNFESNQNYEKQKSPTKTPIDENPEILSFEKFDLSQNFEEFHLDDCEIGEEYNIEIESEEKEEETKSITNQQEGGIENEQNKNNEAVEKSETKVTNFPVKSSTSVEIVRATKNVSGLPNISTLQKAVGNNSTNASPAKKSTNNTQTLNSTSCSQEGNYEKFLECTGLSSKSILTPSRLLSNHRGMLKPKDVKLRDRVRSSATFERHGNTVKYYSEPYL